MLIKLLHLKALCELNHLTLSFLLVLWRLLLFFLPDLVNYCVDGVFPVLSRVSNHLAVVSGPELQVRLLFTH